MKCVLSERLRVRDFTSCSAHVVMFLFSLLLTRVNKKQRASSRNSLSLFLKNVFSELIFRGCFEDYLTHFLWHVIEALSWCPNPYYFVPYHTQYENISLRQSYNFVFILFLRISKRSFVFLFSLPVPRRIARTY